MNQRQRQTDPSSIFLAHVSGTHPYYKRLRDSDSEVEERRFVEESWQMYQPFNPDLDFKNKLAQDVYATLWHLHLARVFMDAGYTLQSTREAEPDLCLLIGGKRVWIEAVATRCGTGVDAVRVPPRSVGCIPEDQIIIRFVQSVTSKVQQHSAMLSRSEYEQDAYMIAVNTGLVDLSDCNDGINIAERALFGIGDYQWIVSREGNEQVKGQYLPRRELLKRSGEPVNVALFADARNRRISSVLFTPFHFRQNWNGAGRDFKFIHNPEALIPLDLTAMTMGTKTWYADGHLHRAENNAA